MPHGRQTTVRPATDADVELLVAWHADPEVSRYWDDETFTVEEMRARLLRRDVDAWIVEADGEPVGYLQSWWETGVDSAEPAKSEGTGFAGAGAETGVDSAEPAKSEGTGFAGAGAETGVDSAEPAKSEGTGFAGAGAETDEPRRGGIDGFLVPGARGRGLMPDAARALAEHLLAEGWTEVTVDPYAWNERAVRGWEKAGFLEVSRHPADEEHTADWVLLRFAPGTLRP